MLIPVARLVTDHDVRDVTGVLHLGAHLGEEADQYDHDLPWADDRRSVVWVEANPTLLPKLNAHVFRRPGHEVVNALVDNAVRDVTFHVASNGESSSVLALGTHATEHPEVTYVGDIQATTTTVDRLAAGAGGWDDLNFLNIDLQGLELRALEGAEEFLKHCRYVYAEVNRKPLYVGCPLIREIDQHLTDFTRTATAWTRHGWGDALYTRKTAL